MPLAGIRVCALAPVSGFEVRCAASRADGHYAIFGLHVGSYVVAFSVSATAIETGVRIEPEDGFVGQYYEGEPTFAAANVLDASAPGAYADVDAQLTRGTGGFGSRTVGAASTSQPSSPVATPPTRLHLCPRHSRKKMVKGKRRCVPVRQQRR
jgi:hypothetical protein